jgi:hypothetical protein
MLKVTLWHEPEYFGFYVRDPMSEISLDASESERVRIDRFASAQGIVTVGVVSEYSTIPITIEFDRNQPEIDESDAWDRIVECGLQIEGNEMVFEGSTGTTFGKLDVWPGTYRLRIYFGGQRSRTTDGESKDFYLIQVWPSPELCSMVLRQ